MKLLTTKTNIRLYTCPYCKEKLPHEGSKRVGNRRYHPKCWETKEREDEEQSRESQSYRELIDYICEIFNMDAPTGMILNQIKRMKEEYNYKNKGIMLSLQYFFEIEGNEVWEDSGIAIVPSVYDKARKHYIMKMNVERSLEGYTDNEVQEVSIDLHRKTETNRRSKQIDVSSL